MGCDIHMSVQLRAVTGYSRNDATARALLRKLEHDSACWPEIEAIELRSGPWETVAIEAYDDTEPPDGWSKVCFPWRGRHDVGDWVATTIRNVPTPWWERRDYESFARLADVRNYNGAPFIDQPRGYPDDWDKPPSMAPEWAYQGERATVAYLGDHSHTWLIAKEIIESEVFGDVRRSGVISWETWVEWIQTDHRNGSPMTWWMDISNIKIVSEDDALRMLNDGIRPEEPCAVRCSWVDGREWQVKTMAIAWAERFGANNVRFVFGFDS